MYEFFPGSTECSGTNVTTCQYFSVVILIFVVHCIYYNSLFIPIVLIHGVASYPQSFFPQRLSLA